MAKEQETEAPKKKSKLKIILLIIIILLLAMGGAGGFWWFQLRTPPTAEIPTPPASQTAEQAATTADSSTTSTEAITPKAPEIPKTVINLVNIPTVTVNLADTNPIRYLKIGMDVEVNTTSAVAALDSQIAKVRDSIIIVLSGKTYSDLATTAGKLIIKNEISTRLNQILGAPRVVQIYFTEFVIQ